ncbi:hypothetical protein AMECASPLE_036364, partial [Ameca splendens]
VSSRSPGFIDESVSRQASSQSDSFHGRQGLYTRRQSLPPPTSCSSSAADSTSKPRLPAPSSEVSLSDPAGRCHFQTDLFVVVEKPESGLYRWDRTPDVTAGLLSTGQCTEVHAGTPQCDEEVKTDQSQDT